MQSQHCFILEFKNSYKSNWIQWEYVSFEQEQNLARIKKQGKKKYIININIKIQTKYREYTCTENIQRVWETELHISWRNIFISIIFKCYYKEKSLIKHDNFQH